MIFWLKMRLLIIGSAAESWCGYLHQTNIFVTVCSYRVTYAFQSESTFYSCLNVKELLAQNRRKIWSLSDCNWIRTNSHLVRKRTLNYLTKLFFYELSSCGFESSCSHLNNNCFFGLFWEYFPKDVQDKKDWHLYPSLCYMLAVIATLLPWSS